MAKAVQQEIESAFRTVVDQQHGELRVDGQAFVLVQREVFAELQKVLESILGRGVEGVLNAAGYRRGRGVGARLETLTGGQLGPYVEGIRTFMAQTGLGHLDRFDVQDGRVLATVTNSFLALGYGTSDRPVCHYLAGFLLAAGGQVLHREDLKSEEVKCFAMAEPDCSFVIGPVFDERPRRMEE